MHKVILRHCNSYDPQRIKAIILAGMDSLNVQPKGHTLVKPNLVMPHKRYFQGCYTRPEFLDGLLGALMERGQKITNLAVGERSGLTIPSRYAFYNAGYNDIIKKHRVKPVNFDEIPSVQIPLNNPQALRPSVFVPEAITKTDFLVNAPKFKIHAWLKVTFALKNYIGLQDDAHRLIDHHYSLHNKVADLQEIIQAGFIAIDGIEAGEYSEIAPNNFPLGLIIMGINPVAVDTVCTHIVGLEPAEVEYIRLAAERGYGPIDLNEIDIVGDVSLAEAQSRANGIRHGAVRLDNYLHKESKINAFLGKPPQGDYCVGGCPGALMEAAQIVEVFQPGLHQEIKPLSFLIGAYTGEIQFQPGTKIIAVGDCTSWSGKLNGKQVDIPSVIKPADREHLTQGHAKDALQKSLAIMATLLRQRNQPVIIVRGCPVPVLECTNILALLGGAANPSMQIDILPQFIYFTLITKLMRIKNHYTSAEII